MTRTSAHLSTTERIGQVNQRLKGWDAVQWRDGAPRITDVLRREVDRWGGIGAIYGILRADPWSQVRWQGGIPPERSAEAYEAVQEYVVANGSGLPTLFVEEAPHGLMALGGTTLPVNLALGAGMDIDLTERLAAVVGAEARSRGSHVALVSGLDMLRDPRWGRAEECFSEDPALSAALVAATVRGMQGGESAERIDRAHVAVVVKHLAAQGAGIGGRNGSGAPIGRRELGELHLRPAYAAARAGVTGFMAAYNDIDGVPCSANRELLTGTLREDWGWQGIVMADGTAIDRLRDSSPDAATAAALALTAGVDLSLWDEAFTHIDEAIDRGILDEAVLTRAADRVLALKERVGLLNEDAPGGNDPDAPDPSIPDLVGRAARQAVVVLHDDALPLGTDRTVALIGPNADDADALLGDYTPPRPPDDSETSTLYGALAERLGAEQVHLVAGSTHTAPAGDDALRAVSAACADADIAVVALGGTSRRSYQDDFADNGAVDGPAPDTTNGEGVDLAKLELPAAQLDVLRASRASSAVVVSVVIDGRPRPLDEVIALSDAVLFVPFPGPHGGTAVVDALFEGSGGGLLPATLPRHDGVLPVAHDERRETARGYVDARMPVGALLGSGLPAGISVTLPQTAHEISADALAQGGTVRVNARVTNDSGRRLSCPIPLYGRRHVRGLRPRRRTLLAFRRVDLAPRESLTIDFDLGLEALGSWESGRPEPAPVSVTTWIAARHDPPEDATTIQVTDERGSDGWQR